MCTDVILTATADGSTFAAHRGVLATFSSVFRHALSPELDCLTSSSGALSAASRRDKHVALPLPNKTGRELRLLTQWLYPIDSRQEKFSKDNIVACMDLAHEYDIALMLAACERWLLSELSHGRIVHLPSAPQPSKSPFDAAEIIAQLGNVEREFYASQGLISSSVASHGGSAVDHKASHRRRQAEAALTVQLLERAHTCGLRTFVATAIDHLGFVRSADLQELLRSPGAASLPSTVLHRMLEVRERAQRPR